jgi:hypothetical protein
MFGGFALAATPAAQALILKCDLPSTDMGMPRSAAFRGVLAVLAAMAG